MPDRAPLAGGPPPLRPFGLVLHHDGRWTHEGIPIQNDGGGARTLVLSICAYAGKNVVICPDFPNVDPWVDIPTDPTDGPLLDPLFEELPRTGPALLDPQETAR